MTYASTITSKGTITVPSSIRHKFNLKPGDKVSFMENTDKNIIEITPLITWEEQVKKNQAILKAKGNWPPEPYKSGDGFKLHVEQKYGTKSIS